MPFSVLMSLYIKERPEFLRQSLDSVMKEQSLKPDEVVIVEDGLLTPELYSVLKEYQAEFPTIKRLPLSQNGGLGKALNAGLRHCSFELVARMDTDDVCKPERFAKQVSFMEEHQEISVCGSWIDEFIGTTENVISQRITVNSPEAIRKYAKSRNPMNHPTVMFRKSAVLAVGSYEHFPLFEDWYLWVRLLKRGYSLANIPESLLFFRSSDDMFKRRGGWEYAKDSARFQFKLKQLGLIGPITALKNSLIRGGVYIMPNFIRKWVYSHVLR